MVRKTQVYLGFQKPERGTWSKVGILFGVCEVFLCNWILE